MMQLGDKFATGSQAENPAYTCNVCGKKGQYTNIKDHIEANHIESVYHPCKYCDKTFRFAD